MIKIYFNPEQKVSKEQACYRLGISRATFDNGILGDTLNIDIIAKAVIATLLYI